MRVYPGIIASSIAVSNVERGALDDEGTVWFESILGEEHWKESWDTHTHTQTESDREREECKSRSMTWRKVSAC